MILGASFDSVEDQRAFAEAESFGYQLLSDPDQRIGAAYDAVRQEGEDYYGMPLPRRISYLIDPAGKIHKAYDVENDKLDLGGHALRGFVGQPDPGRSGGGGEHGEHALAGRRRGGVDLPDVGVCVRAPHDYRVGERRVRLTRSFVVLPGRAGARRLRRAMRSR